MKHLPLFLFAISLSICTLGCGTATPTALVAVGTVVISPSSTTTLIGGGSKQFTATVKNASNSAVNWEVNGVVGGSPVTGTISSSGLYAAPAIIPSLTTVTITAVSQADASQSASAQVMLDPVIVTISPVSVSLAAAGKQQFTATVQNASNTAVLWQVSGGGTISAGLYTAPATVSSPMTVTVTAISQLDMSKTAAAQVTVTGSTPPVSGNSFYVSSTGNDSNPGTLTSPWRTIQHAANTVQAGDTVYVRAGTYNESVNVGVSGSSSAGPVTFASYPGETAIVDGTGLPVSGTQGLFNIVDQSYVTIQGFEIRNYTTSSAQVCPSGIWVTGSGSHIQILNNRVHNITTTSEKNGNAFGIAVYGSEAPASIDSISITGNQVYNLKTGNSETLNVDGNVTNFTISNNLIHDNDNIGIDAIGFEGVSPDPAYDYARNGEISGNTVYNISAINNPGEGNQYDADGIYVDGGSNIVIERNLVYNNDLNIEAASEHSGHVSSYITIRNNVVHHGNSVGISIGGYASNVGGSDHISIVNNTLFDNDTKNTGSGELQVQYYATNNIFENNIVYATSQGLFINNYTNSEASPVKADYNIYYSSVSWSAADFVWNGTDHTGFPSYQSATGEDSHSQYVDPLFLSLTTPNLDIEATSPAVNAGLNLGTTIEGAFDFAGNPRVVGSSIDIGAYQQ
jgi:Right handed beta helix region